MDFSYFSSAPQPYQIFAIPQPAAPGQPGQSETYRQPSNPQEHYDAAFANFQQNFQYNPTPFLPQTQASRSPSTPKRHDSIVSGPDLNPHSQQESASEEPATIRSSSEEKDTLTPAQSRRKAQNRAAQRAFRERKERHVKDLEAKLASLQHQSQTLNGENERLRRELAKIATENEILRATSGMKVANGQVFNKDGDEVVNPANYVPIDAVATHALSRESSVRATNSSNAYTPFGTTASTAVDGESEDPLLTASATWDYILAHELFQNGLIDIGDVCERLKKVARCDGNAPMFQEVDVRKAIMESAVAGGRDELI